MSALRPHTSRRTVTSVAIAIFGTWLVTACGAGTGEGLQREGAPDSVESTQEAVLSNCASGQLSAPFKQHSCDHYTYGPYKFNRTATTSGSYPWFGVATGDGPPTPGVVNNYGATHVYYTVGLPGSGSSFSGKMRFRPVSNGDHAIFFNNASVTIKPTGGSNLAPDAVISPSPGAMSCIGFSGYDVFTLNNTTTYEVSLTASVSSVNILFEQVSEFITRSYQDSDADTWGNPSGSLLTACVPPAGYTAIRGSDCNDGNASINPTAPEICGDLIDSNCDGSDCT